MFLRYHRISTASSSTGLVVVRELGSSHNRINGQPPMPPSPGGCSLSRGSSCADRKLLDALQRTRSFDFEQTKLIRTQLVADVVRYVQSVCDGQDEHGIVPSRDPEFGGPILVHLVLLEGSTSRDVSARSLVVLCHEERLEPICN